MEALKFQHSIRINRDQETVWKALTESEWTRKYMYGSDVHSSWEKGSTILWTGSYMGVSYSLKGIIKDIYIGFGVIDSNKTSTSNLAKAINYLKHSNN